MTITPRAWLVRGAVGGELPHPLSPCQRRRGVLCAGSGTRQAPRHAAAGPSPPDTAPLHPRAAANGRVVPLGIRDGEGVGVEEAGLAGGALLAETDRDGHQLSLVGAHRDEARRGTLTTCWWFPR